MLNEKVVSLINKQINLELHSAYLYLGISGYYANEELTGFAHWFAAQAKEELDHARRFATYLADNSAKVELTDIKAPHFPHESYDQPLVASLKHEQAVTHSIHQIYADAQGLNDYRTVQFLDWFVKEQNEEEKNAESLIKRYEVYASDGKGLYLLDSELQKRA